MGSVHRRALFVSAPGPRGHKKTIQKAKSRGARPRDSLRGRARTQSTLQRQMLRLLLPANRNRYRMRNHTRNRTVSAMFATRQRKHSQRKSNTAGGLTHGLGAEETLRVPAHPRRTRTPVRPKLRPRQRLSRFSTMRKNDFVRPNWNRADQPDSSFCLTKLFCDPWSRASSTDSRRLLIGR